MKIFHYVIYQTPVNTPYCFHGFNEAMKANMSGGDYVHVYHGDIASETINSALEDLFIRFNVNRPNDYCGRSLSVSDVVVLEGKPYYCDRVGFSEIPKENWR